MRVFFTILLIVCVLAFDVLISIGILGAGHEIPRKTMVSIGKDFLIWTPLLIVLIILRKRFKKKGDISKLE